MVGYHTCPADPQCIVAGCLWQRPEREDHGVLLRFLEVFCTDEIWFHTFDGRTPTDQRVDSEKIPLGVQAFMHIEKYISYTCNGVLLRRKSMCFNDF